MCMYVYECVCACMYERVEREREKSRDGWQKRLLFLFLNAPNRIIIQYRNNSYLKKK